MTSRISRPAYGTDFSTILNEFWIDFLQFSAKDGWVSHPPTPPLMCAPGHTIFLCTKSNLHQSPACGNYIRPKYCGKQIMQNS